MIPPSFLPLVRWVQDRWGRRSPDVVAAYRAKLDPKDPQSLLILRDLAVYCRAGVSAAASTPHETAINAGLQDAFTHICDMLALRPDQVIFDLGDYDNE